MSHGRFPNAAKSFLALNLHLANPELQKHEVGPRKEAGYAPPVRPELERHSEPRNVGKAEKKIRDPRRFFVRITSVRKRLLDEDNLCAKYVCDCCRYAGILPGDDPAQTRIESCQRKVAKGEEECTEVEIFVLDEPIPTL